MVFPEHHIYFHSKYRASKTRCVLQANKLTLNTAETHYNDLSSSENET